ncbi:hypothetical protein F4808DRAFT_443111 [Astrocystis sublimbata]|nr:hypothetical protein F4808DRAFT_443111 [Astrocystis sublimbata]
MAPSAYPATAAGSRRELSVNELRVPLARLTLNQKPKPNPHRVNKHVPAKPATRSTAPPYRRWASPIPRPITPLDLNPTEMERARAIFDKLRTMSDIRHRSPRLRPSSDGRDQLVYPDYAVLKFLGPGHMYESIGSVTMDKIRAISHDVFSDIARLYRHRIPYAPDVARLYLLEERQRGVYKPVIDTFDYARHIDDDPAAWKAAKKDMINHVHERFRVLKRLQKVRDPLETYPDCTRPLLPDAVAEIAKEAFPGPFQLHHTITQVKQYSPSFGRCVLNTVYYCLNRVPWRRRCGSLPQKEIDQLHICSYALSHGRSLLEPFLESAEDKLSALDDLVAFCVLRTVLLINLHAAQVRTIASHGIIISWHIEPKERDFTSYEGFRSVADAWSQMQESWRLFKQAGGGLLNFNIQHFLFETRPKSHWPKYMVPPYGCEEDHEMTGQPDNQ